jgi:hypothetical protein
LATPDAEPPPIPIPGMESERSGLPDRVGCAKVSVGRGVRVRTCVGSSNLNQCAGGGFHRGAFEEIGIGGGPEFHRVGEDEFSKLIGID